jgi:hypothetical protein
VGDGKVVVVDGIVASLVAVGRRPLVRDERMTEEIELDPLRGTAAFRTAKGLSIRSTCGVEVVNREGKYERA